MVRVTSVRILPNFLEMAEDSVEWIPYDKNLQVYVKLCNILQAEKF